MKISSSFNIDGRKQNYQSFKGVPPNPKFYPESLGNLGKVVGEYVGMPEQKLIMATTALLFVPLIDLKFADEDKKVDSAIKSASKAIAGGLTGVTIRAAFIALTDNLIGLDKSNRFNHHFMPDKVVDMLRNEPVLTKLQLNQYKKSLGTLFAIAFMVLFSNSKVDVPLTSDLQDLISGVVKDKKSWLQSFSDVKDARMGKINNWLDKWRKRFESVGNKASQIGKILIGDKVKKKESSK